MKPYVYLAVVLIPLLAGAVDKLEVDIGGIQKLRKPICTGTLMYNTSTHTFTCGSGSGTTPSAACGAGTALFWNGSAYSCVSNISTASALLTNPSDCAANEFAHSIENNGNLTCSTYLHNLWSTTHPDVYTPDVPDMGSMIYYSDETVDLEVQRNKWRLIQTPATNDYFLRSGSTTITPPAWTLMPGCTGAQRALNYDDAANTFSCNAAIAASTASTASALAANGANCSAGSYPLGVSDVGAAESCTVAQYQTIYNPSSVAMTQRAVVQFNGSAMSVADGPVDTPARTHITVNKPAQSAAYTTRVSVSPATATSSTAANNVYEQWDVSGTPSTVTYSQSVANQIVVVQACVGGFAGTANTGWGIRVTYNGVVQNSYPMFFNVASDHRYQCFIWRFTGASTAGSYAVVLQTARTTGAVGNVLTRDNNDSWSLLVE